MHWDVVLVVPGVVWIVNRLVEVPWVEVLSLQELPFTFDPCVKEAFFVGELQESGLDLVDFKHLLNGQLLEVL